MSNEISISHRTFAPTACEDVIDALQRSAVIIGVRITPTTSIVPSEDNTRHHNVEHGCSIKFTTHGRQNVASVWGVLKMKFPQLQCAHLWINGSYDGCVLDYLRPSSCPGPSDVAGEIKKIQTTMK